MSNNLAISVAKALDPAFPVQWRPNEMGELRAFYMDPESQREYEAAWCPQDGSQIAFLMAHAVFEVLYEGTRGPGKTDCLLMDFFQHVGKGWGAEWRGILFRQTYPQLADVINKSKKWFKLLCPKAKYNESNHTWTFPDGEQLLLRHMKTSDDYWNYHGHAYPWIGWEELCNWADSKCYTVMMSCCRSTKPGMPRCYRATTNPYGPGHNWVKSRFRLPQARGKIIRDSMRDGEREPPRVAIHGSIYENKILLHADPDYISKIRAAARNPSELKAWIDGSWDIVAGGMFDDLWRGDVHVVPSFPLRYIPKGWRIDRSHDWGSSKPFANLWFAESNGEPFEWQGRTYGRVKGDIYLIQEWYGWNGTRNEGVRMLAVDVGRGVRDREEDWDIDKRCVPGPADSAIYDEENGNNIAKDMEKAGCRWVPADKGPGSRKQGWEQIRKLLKGALPNPNGGPRETPGLFVFDWCLQTLETLPNLSRDDKDLDDVDTDSEDHIGDALRYRVRKKTRGVKARPSN
ncbi:terminase large subunit [Stenotrophomonas phage Sonora]|nr:terminase large subunit [Stenotrophomonas phage Sonora]